MSTSRKRSRSSASLGSSPLFSDPENEQLRRRLHYLNKRQRTELEKKVHDTVVDYLGTRVDSVSITKYRRPQTRVGKELKPKTLRSKTRSKSPKMPTYDRSGHAKLSKSRRKK